MDDVSAKTEALLDEKPELEEGLREILEVDAEAGEWGFEEIPLDSGEFGEVVSREIVEESDDGYRVADRNAVEAALDADASHESSPGTLERAVAFEPADRLVPDVELREVLALAGALALVVLFRIVPYPQVFRGGDVVLSSNDPYYYRYLVDQLARQASGPFDVSVLASLPAGAAHGEPLLVTTLWWVTEVLGGADGLVLAWFPVVSAVVTGILVYVLARELTGDRRVGLAAVTFLAIMPGHAFRTGLGFADHHAFDYPWLALTALVLVLLADRDLRDVRTWGLATVLGVSVAAQTLTWDNGPLLLVPVGLYVSLKVLADVRAGESPIRGGRPIVAGLGVGAVVVYLVHAGWGWHSTAVAHAPALLLVAVGGVLLTAEAVFRLDGSVRTLAGLETLGAIGGFVLLPRVVPNIGDALDRGFAVLFDSRDVAETVSLFGEEMGSMLGPVFLFGFVLFLAVPYMVWYGRAVYRRDDHEGGLALVVYSAYFLALSLVQIRFVGELSPFVAVFAGLGFVHVASWVELVRRPAVFPEVAEDRSNRSGESGTELAWPERRTFLQTAGLWTGVGSLGLMLAPLKHSQVTTSPAAHEAAKWMEEHARERGWEYPQNYVFSSWSRNRMYNWFVNGSSDSYGYARQNYVEFLQSPDPEEWYDRLSNRVGFVVLDDTTPDILVDSSIYSGLQSYTDGDGPNGEEPPDENGLGHYRVSYISSDRSTTVFTLVPGATITGPGVTDESFDVSTEVDVPKSPVLYERTVTVNEHGVYRFRTPHPGTYELDGRTVEVSERDVANRTRFSFFEGDGAAHWAFEEGGGGWLYDRVGGNHGRIVNAEWRESQNEYSLEFPSDQEAYIAADPESGSVDEFTITSLIKFGTSNSGAILSAGCDGWSGSTHGFLFDHGHSGWSDDRLGLYVGDGERNDTAVSPSLGLDYPSSFHHVAIVFDEGEIIWYLDYEEIGRTALDLDTVSFDPDRRAFIGREYSSRGGEQFFRGQITEVRYYRSALSDISPGQ